MISILHYMCENFNPYVEDQKHQQYIQQANKQHTADVKKLKFDFLISASKNLHDDAIRKIATQHSY